MRTYTTGGPKLKAFGIGRGPLRIPRDRHVRVSGIKQASKGLAMQIKEFDMAMGKHSQWDAVQTRQIEQLRNGFKSLLSAVELLHAVLSNKTA